VIVKCPDFDSDLAADDQHDNQHDNHVSPAGAPRERTQFGARAFAAPEG
jgi:hypothetical protein